MGPSRLEKLSRRERQIMDVLFRRGRATVSEVIEGMPDPPSYSAVRTMLRRLEEKGFLRHEEKGRRYVFLPRLKRKTACDAAIENLVDTFFDGSPKKAAAALLDRSAADLTDEELNELWGLVEDARKEGR